MVAHIVMWNFKDSIREEEKAQLKQDMKLHLEALVGKVPGLLELKFVENPLKTSTHEICLVSKLEEEKDIKVYGSHPEHVAVADRYVRPYTCDRACLDYVLN